MRRLGSIAAILMSAVLVTISSASVQGQQQSATAEIFKTSLHYSNRGLAHWYAKENGGLERITGIPFSEMAGCNRCHVRTCDTCHVKVVEGKAVYSLAEAKAETACRKCHSIESQDFAKENPENKTADVHFVKGMKCMDCHSSREIHGDGKSYDSMQSPGAMDTSCQKCHVDLSKCPSQAIHKGKVDCTACHVREVSSCFNCHIDTRIKEGKSVSIPLKNMLFLINHEGKVTLGNLHTFVYQNKTLIVFAPAFSHWVMKEGRKCVECHATQVIQSMEKGTFKPVSWENDTAKNATGIIPVLDGWKWDFVFLNYVNAKWVPIDKPTEPLVNYSGYSQPITKEQFALLSWPQK